MKKHIPSKLLNGEAGTLREHALTRWMSRDLTQAAVDFCRNLGLVPAYCECSSQHLTRYLFWKPPEGALVEVRSGRARDTFEEFDSVNRERKLKLLSLHINQGDVYSAVWISSQHFEAAKTFLAANGISVAKTRDA